MSTPGGGRPGIKVKATVAAVGASEITLLLHKEGDTSYFKVGDEFLAEFHPVALGEPGGGENEPSGG